MQSTINNNIEKKCYTKKVAIFSTMHIEKKSIFIFSISFYISLIVQTQWEEYPFQ